MSGHSKWSKVKHQKATTDAVKSRAFTRASRGVTVAVREGGGIGDPDKNFRLRLAIEFARSVNMPKENIERAIQRGTDRNSAGIDSVVYEGYGPGGVAMLVLGATDNHQRTSANVKHSFDHAGGSVTSPGAVSYLFRKRGVLLVDKNGVTYDAVLEAGIRAGADDVTEKDDVYEVYTDIQQFFAVKEAFSQTGFVIIHSAIVMHADTTVSPSEEIARKIGELTDVLEAYDDVLEVYTNLDA